LLFLHAGDVLLEGSELSGLGGVVTEELGKLSTVGGIFVDAELKVLGEGFIELVEVFLVLGDVGEHFKGLLGQVLLDDAKDLVLLKVLTGDVEGKVFGVDNTLDEAQVLRDEILAVIHDEHTADVKLDVVLLLLGLEEVEGGSLGHEEHGSEGELTLNGEVLDRKVFFPVVGHALVEGGILFGLDFLGVASPEGLGLVEDFKLSLGFGDLLGLLFLLFVIIDFFDLGAIIFLVIFLIGVIRDFLGLFLGGEERDGEADEFRVLLDEVLDGLFLEEVELILLEVKDDLSSSGEGLVVSVGGDSERVTSLRGPAVLGVLVVLGVHDNSVGNEIGGVETHTELTNHGQVGASVDGLNETLGTGLGDGTEVVDEFILSHTNTSISDGEGTSFLVGDELDVKGRFGFKGLGVLKTMKANLVQSIGSIGDQLTKKDFFVGVESVDNQTHELSDIGVERIGLAIIGSRHR